MSAELPGKQMAPGAFIPQPSAPAVPSSLHGTPGFLVLRCLAYRTHLALPARPPGSGTAPAPYPHPWETGLERGGPWPSPAQVGTPRPPAWGPARKVTGYRTQEGPNFSCRSPRLCPARHGLWGLKAAQKGCLGGQGQLRAEVRGQEGFLKPKSCPRPQGQGQALGPGCLGTLGFL